MTDRNPSRRAVHRHPLTDAPISLRPAVCSSSFSDTIFSFHPSHTCTLPPPSCLSCPFFSCFFSSFSRAVFILILLYFIDPSFNSLPPYSAFLFLSLLYSLSPSSSASVFSRSSAFSSDTIFNSHPSHNSILPQSPCLSSCPPYPPIYNASSCSSFPLFLFSSFVLASLVTVPFAFLILLYIHACG